MTIPPQPRAEIDIREEADIVRVDPTFLERQRNRYASRGLAFSCIVERSLLSHLLMAYQRR